MADWNERYRQGECASNEPHPVVVQFASGLPPGRALDVACGAGRHAIWLAERGWRVTAVDKATAAIEILRQRSLDKGVQIDAVTADLERGEFSIQPRMYDLIVLCNYLQRDLFAPIKNGIEMGGVVIAIVSMFDADPNVKPMNPAYLVNPGELRAQFKGWDLIWDYEGKPPDRHKRASAEVVARRRSP
jgi:tellurite methyltransferase